MAATVRAYQATSTGPTTTNVDSDASGTSPLFGTDDAVQSSNAQTIPSDTGTTFACPKAFFLNVTSAGSTTISNRKAKLSEACATGMTLSFKALGTYAQQSAPADSASAGAVPTGFTALTTSLQTWDSGSDSSASTGKSGDYLLVALSVDNTYTGGANSSADLPNIVLSYDEQ